MLSSHPSHSIRDDPLLIPSSISPIPTSSRPFFCVGGKERATIHYYFLASLCFRPPISCLITGKRASASEREQYKIFQLSKTFTVILSNQTQQPNSANPTRQPNLANPTQQTTQQPTQQPNSSTKLSNQTQQPNSATQQSNPTQQPNPATKLSNPTQQPNSVTQFSNPTQEPNSVTQFSNPTLVQLSNPTQQPITQQPSSIP